MGSWRHINEHTAAILFKGAAAAHASRVALLAAQQIPSATCIGSRSATFPCLRVGRRVDPTGLPGALCGFHHEDALVLQREYERGLGAPVAAILVEVRAGSLTDPSEAVRRILGAVGGPP